MNNSGDEEEEEPEDEEDDGFFVPHGHLSDEELDEDDRLVFFSTFLLFKAVNINKNWDFNQIN